MSTCVSSWIVAGVGELGGWRIGDAMRIAKAQDEVCGQLNSHGVFIVGCRKRGGVGGGTLGFIIVPLFFHPRSMAASIQSIVNFVITAQIFTPILNTVHTRALFCAWPGLAWPGLGWAGFSELCRGSFR
jgi:hypothetical protein